MKTHYSFNCPGCDWAHEIEVDAYGEDRLPSRTDPGDSAVLEYTFPLACQNPTLEDGELCEFTRGWDDLEKQKKIFESSVWEEINSDFEQPEPDYYWEY